MVRTLVSRGSLAYMLVSNVRKSLSVLPAFEILLWEQDIFVFLAFAKVLYIESSASQVERQRATCIVFSFRYIYVAFFTVAICESLIFPVKKASTKLLPVPSSHPKPSITGSMQC